MPIESDSDRLAMLKACGEQVTLNNGQNDWDIWVILDAQYVDVNGIQGYRPTALCRDIDLAMDAPHLAAPGTTMMSSKGGFTIRVMQEDGTGMTTLVLEEGE